MSLFRRIEILEPSSPSLFIRETSIFKLKPPTFHSFADEDLGLGFTLDLLNPHCCPPHFIDHRIPTTPFDFIDLIEKPQIPRQTFTDVKLRSLRDRVSALELGLKRAVKAKKVASKKVDTKYTWQTEIVSADKNGVDRKYKIEAEIKGGKICLEKNYKWTAEIKGKGKESPISRTYTFKASTKPTVDSGTKQVKKVAPTTRVVEIDQAQLDQGAIVLRQAFAKRAGAVKNGKGKKKELSPQDAALMIQMTFKAYLVRRSQALRALRELALAKAKLKEIRGLFNNFSYRRHIVRDAEEQQKFSERIIVLLLTVDAIEKYLRS
ncbi:hypothetical protein GIB67_013143 [Kingdonia uniflora]|uniref:Uncharacterized protein n=1 Tax=Kingdonia uniflora TaxID=39325 RepID=A0A7J7LPK1_9MAGN|nr:hypothetical protein GIB67_013143 [Kingdonia uniflora]